MSKAKSAKQQIKEAKAALQRERVLKTLKEAGLPEPIEEFKFAAGTLYDGRQWLSDYAYPDRLLLIEIEGGVYSQGRHTRGTGYANDCEKYSACNTLGYTLLRFITQDIGTDYMKQAVKLAYDVHTPQQKRNLRTPNPQ